MFERVPIDKDPVDPTNEVVIGGKTYFLADCFSQGGTSLLYYASEEKGAPARRIIKEWYPSDPYVPRSALCTSDHEQPLRHEYELGLEAGDRCSYVLTIDALDDSGRFGVMKRKSEDSETLSHLRESLLKDLPPLDRLRYSLTVASSLLSDLESLHKSGILHCDIKLDNVLWAIGKSDRQSGVNGHAWLIDFGSALRLREDGRTEALAKAVPSTPGYRSYVLKNSSGQRLDPSEDYFSVGCLLFYLICGMLHRNSDDLVDKFWFNIYEDDLRPFLKKALPDVPGSLVNKTISLIDYLTEEENRGSVEIGRIKKSVSDLLADIARYEQPHAVAKLPDIPNNYIPRREKEAQIIGSLAANTVTYLSGMPGAGKRALARAAAAGFHHGTIILSLPDEQSSDAVSLLESASFELSSDQSGTGISDSAKRANILLEWLNRENLLVLVENLNSREAAPDLINRLKDRLAPSGRLLITGSLSDRDLTHSDISILSIPCGDDEGKAFCRALFLQCADIKEAQCDEYSSQYLRELLENLGYNCALTAVIGNALRDTSEDKQSLLRRIARDPGAAVHQVSENQADFIATAGLTGILHFSETEKRVLSLLLQYGRAIPEGELCILLGDHGFSHTANRAAVEGMIGHSLIRKGQNGLCELHQVVRLLFRGTETGAGLADPADDDLLCECLRNTLWLDEPITPRAFHLFFDRLISLSEKDLGNESAAALLFPELCSPSRYSAWAADREPRLLYRLKGPEHRALRITDGHSPGTDLIAVGEGEPLYESAELIRAFVPRNDCGILTVPERIDGIPTESIGRYAFSDRNGTGEPVSSVTIGSGITHLNDCAFLGCRQLKEVRLPNSLTHIGKRCFEGCLLLKSVSLPSALLTVEDRAFRDCLSLELSLDHDRLEYIGESAFENCRALTRVDLKRIGTLGRRAFSGCTGLKTVLLKGNLPVLGAACFSGCTELGSAVLPDSIDTVEAEAFFNCGRLESLRLPGRMRLLGNAAFQGCTSLREVRMPREAGQLGKYLFYGCSKLGSILLPEGPTCLDYLSFCGCSRLFSVTVPASVERILFAFSGCTSLQQVTYGGTEQQWRRMLICDRQLEQMNVQYRK